MSSTKTLVQTSTLEAILNETEILQSFLALCNEHWVQPLLVGGAVRDMLLKGKLSKDLDFVVPKGKAKQLAEAFSERSNGKMICLDEHYGIYRVILFPDLWMLDIADCIGADIDADLRRRDLTINAIAYDFTRHALLDPMEGQRDLRKGVIRIVDEANLLDDPLRLIRVFRVGAELDFHRIEPETINACRRHAEKLIQAAPERIHYELMRLLSSKNCYTHVQGMANTGLLEVIFPELTPTRQVPANFYHHLGLFDHTLELLRQEEIHVGDLTESAQATLQLPVNPFTKR